MRSIEDARRYIDERYLASYRDNGYGLYAVVENASSKLIGACGFVRRDALPGPDIGFSFLPEYEGKGYGFESATAVMEYGRAVLGFDEVLAITSLDNDASEKLLTKLGFTFDDTINFNGEPLNLFVKRLIPCLPLVDKPRFVVLVSHLRLVYPKLLLLCKLFGTFQPLPKISRFDSR